jgi:hypothetical protein
MSKEYCEVKSTGEVYDANHDKLVASIQGHLRLDKTEAERRLATATIDDPIDLGSETAWTEYDEKEN